MGSVGDSYDNALMENFFSTLKIELVYRHSWRTRDEAENAIFSHYGWYNPAASRKDSADSHPTSTSKHGTGNTIQLPSTPSWTHPDSQVSGKAGNLSGTTMTLDRTPVRAGVTLTTLTPVGLLTVLLGLGLSVLDFFIVNIALPTIDRTLDASPAMLELVVAAYGIAYGVLLVLGGRLGDTFGRRRLFNVGLARFTLTSLVCGLAPTVGVLVAGRAAQGAAAALMVPHVLATIQATTQGERRSRAVGWVRRHGGTSAGGWPTRPVTLWPPACCAPEPA